MTTENLVRIQTDPASGNVQAFFEKSAVIDGVTYRQPWTEVSWPLGKYGEVFSQVLTIANQERAAQLAAAEAAKLAAIEAARVAAETPATPAA